MPRELDVLNSNILQSLAQIVPEEPYTVYETSTGVGANRLLQIAHEVDWQRPVPLFYIVGSVGVSSRSGLALGDHYTTAWIKFRLGERRWQANLTYLDWQSPTVILSDTQQVYYGPPAPLGVSDARMFARSLELITPGKRSVRLP